MGLTRSFMLERFRARDVRCDGRFLGGVLTTGIYCLPSCPARLPKEENLEFFPDPASARAAGLRPCKRCQPDAFYRGENPDRSGMERIDAALESDPAQFADVREMARHGGFGLTKLTELCRAAHHAPPAQLLAEAKIRAATDRLGTSKERVLEVGLNAGFESPSAFHENFRRSTGLTPGAYRAMLGSDAFLLTPPANLRWEDLCKYQTRDSQSASERATPSGGFAIALSLDRGTAELRLERRGESVHCQLSSNRELTSPDRVQAHATALRLLGWPSEPAAFEALLERRELMRLASDGRGTRVPLAAHPFEALTWAIVGQQIHLAFAFELRRTVIALAGAETINGLRAHPSADAIARLDYSDLTGRRFSRRKAEYLIDTARAVATGALDLERRRHVPERHEDLCRQRGIGPWTAAYVLMRGYGNGDCVPVGDSALTSGLQRFFQLSERPGPDETRDRMRVFAPYRSLATFHLWRFNGAPT